VKNQAGRAGGRGDRAKTCLLWWRCSTCSPSRANGAWAMRQPSAPA